MEMESQEILLNSLSSSGVSIPPNVLSIRDLNATSLFSICAQVLNRIDGGSESHSYSTSLPDSVADQFKICSEIAFAMKNLGYIGDMSFHKFLYPSEDDLYKLIRFLVERLSKASDGRSNVLDGRGGRKDLNAENFKCLVEDQPAKLDHDVSVFTQRNVQNEFTNLNISEETRCSDSTVNRSSNLLFDQSMGEVAMDAAADSRKQKVSTTIAASKDYEASGKDVISPRKNVSSVSKVRNEDVLQTCERNTETEQFQNQESKLVEEVTLKTSELEHLQMELEMLMVAAQMAFDNDHPIELPVQQLEEQINFRKQNLLAMKSQWDVERKLLENRRHDLQELLCTNNPKAQEKMKKLREVEQEREFIESEIRTWEEENSKLSTDLEKQPKQASRRSYIDRVKETTKNSRKQDADINQILKETRELQLESNTVQDRLHRTHAVVDELVLREVKKGAIGRQAYKVLTSIHENFEQISNKIMATDRLRREIEEYEKKISALASRSLNCDKLQADLDAIKRENDILEQQTSSSKAC